MKILCVVLEVVQRLQGVLQALVLELPLRPTVVVPLQTLLGLVLEELLKLLEGFFVGHKPLLWRVGKAKVKLKTKTVMCTEAGREENH